MVGQKVKVTRHRNILGVGHGALVGLLIVFVVVIFVVV